MDNYKFDSFLMKLPRVKRWGNYYLLDPESDSDHTSQMISLALMNIKSINARKSELGLPSIDIKELVYRCAIHDYDECFSGGGDIPRIIKHYDKSISNEIDRVVFSLLDKELDDKDLLYEIIHAKLDCIEGTWVAILDIVQAGYKMIYEGSLGNKLFEKELKSNKYYLEELKGDLSDDKYIVEREFIDDFIDTINNHICI